jgi:hypothetical protein
MTVTQPRPTRPLDSRPPRRFDVDLAIRVLAAVLAAAAICGLAYHAYPDALSVRTDIVGYPIFQDFNYRRDTVEYLLIVVAFPVIAITIFSALEVLARRRGGLPARPSLPTSAVADEPEPAPTAGQAAAMQYLKVAGVGVLIAVATAVATGASTSWPLLLGLPITIVYVLIARPCAALIGRARAIPAIDALAGVNATVAAATLLGLAGAAAATDVEVTGPGLTFDYPFAPAWALIAIAVIAVGIVFALLRRAPVERWPRIETWTLLIVAAPVSVYLVVAQVHGELFPPDFFHEGERLGASQLVLDAGRFPWRDLLFTHGLLADVFFPGLDTAAIEHSRWGFIAGEELIELPLTWLSTFALCVYLFRRNWLFLVGIILLLALGWLDPVNSTRMFLLPLSLLALAALLARSTWPRAFAFMAVTGAQAVLVPEASAYSLIAWAVVVAYELVNRRLPEAKPLRASRSLRIAAAGAALLAGFVVFLAANDAIDGFVSYYGTFVGGHNLTGTFPIQWDDLGFHVWAYLPVVVILAAWGYAAARVWSGRWLTTADWVVATGVIGLIPYYLKFLGRADSGHLYQVAAAAVIPALYLVYRLLQVVDERARRSGRAPLAYRPATLAVVVLIVVLAPGSPVSTIRDLPGNYVGTASTMPPDPRLGYLIPGNDEQFLQRIQAVVDRYAPDGEVFDFTNSPLLFSYLVDAQPATRYFHVSMAIPADAQRDLIDELRDADPPLVAYTSEIHGLPEWDGISNPVRHYLVSDYLLDHYHPVARVDDYVFMASDRDPAAPPEVRDPNELLLRGLACNWQYAPNFLDQAPPGSAPRTRLEVVSRGQSFGARGWAVDNTANPRPVPKVFVVAGDRVIATAKTGERRDDVVVELGATGVRYSGFDLRTRIPTRYAGEIGRLSYYGLTRAGTAGPLASTEGLMPAQTPSSLRMPDASRVPVERDAIRGQIDGLFPVMDRYRLSGPSDPSAFDWLEVSAAPPPGGSAFIVSDGNDVGSRAVAFDSLPGRHSEQVRVGACPQWKGYGKGPVYLDVTPGTGSPDATLVR